MSIAPTTGFFRDRATTAAKCPKCLGEGYVELPDGRVKRCVCRIEEQFISYLTPTFAEALWIKPADGFDTTVLEGRNVLIQNTNKLPDVSFNRIYTVAVKSYLANHGMKLKFHNCIGAQAVIDSLYSPDPTPNQAYQMLQEVDLLLLYIARDPPNKHYSQILTGLLRKRGLLRRMTWVITPFRLVPMDDGVLDVIYGREFIDYIKPRQKNDVEGMGAGNFLLFDAQPIISHLSPAKDR